MMHVTENRSHETGPTTALHGIGLLIIDYARTIENIRQDIHMGYKLNIINRIKDSAYTFMEVQSKTGISRTRIETMHRKNDAKFSDLYAIARFLECDIKDLYMEDERFDSPESSKAMKHRIRQEKKDEICTIVKKHFPEDVKKMQELMKITESDVCLRLWHNRFTPRAQGRVLRLTGDSDYLPSLQEKVSALKDNLEQ